MRYQAVKAWPVGGRRGSGRRAAGFTLLELMFAVIVAAILLGIAIPNFRRLTLSSRLTATANEMVTALNTARAQAIKSNAYAQFCANTSAANGSDTLGSACGTSTGAVYGLVNGTATAIRGATPGLDDSIKLKSAVVAVRFSGDGIGHGVTSTSSPLTQSDIVVLCTTGMSTSNIRTIGITTGSVITTTTSTGTCS